MALMNRVSLSQKMAVNGLPVVCNLFRISLPGWWCGAKMTGKRRSSNCRKWVWILSVCTPICLILRMIMWVIMVPIWISGWDMKMILMQMVRWTLPLMQRSFIPNRVSLAGAEQIPVIWLEEQPNCFPLMVTHPKLSAKAIIRINQVIQHPSIKQGSCLVMSLNGPIHWQWKQRQVLRYPLAKMLKRENQQWSMVFLKFFNSVWRIPMVWIFFLSRQQTSSLKGCINGWCIMISRWIISGCGQRKYGCPGVVPHEIVKGSKQLKRQYDQQLTFTTVCLKNLSVSSPWGAGLPERRVNRMSLAMYYLTSMRLMLPWIHPTI